jgi:hypothetical protein
LIEMCAVHNFYLSTDFADFTDRTGPVE